MTLLSCCCYCCAVLSENAARFLLRPRDTIREHAACVLRHAKLRPHCFTSVHIRDSAEKRAELKSHGHSQPPVSLP